MSFTYSEQKGVISHGTAVFLALIITAAELLPIRDIFAAFTRASGAWFLLILNIISLVNIVMWIVLTICLIAGSCNHTLGVIASVFAICNMLYCVTVLYKNDWNLDWRLLLTSAAAITYQAVMAKLLLPSDRATLQRLWFLPGIISILTIAYYLEDPVTYIHFMFNSITNCITMLICPVITSIFTFFIMWWAAVRDDADAPAKVYQAYTNNYGQPMSSANLKPLDIPQSSEEAEKMKCPLCGAPKNLNDEYCIKCRQTLT